MAGADAIDQHQALEAVTRSILRSIAAAADADALRPEAQEGVQAMALALLSDAASGIPSVERIKLLANAHDLIDQFLSACIAESA